MLDYTKFQIKPLISATIPMGQTNSREGNNALQEILIGIAVISVVIVGYNYIQERKRLRREFKYPESKA